MVIGYVGPEMWRESRGVRDDLILMSEPLGVAQGTSWMARVCDAGLGEPQQGADLIGGLDGVPSGRKNPSSWPMLKLSVRGGLVGPECLLIQSKKEVRYAHATQNHQADGGGDPAYGAHLFCAPHGGMADLEARWRVCPSDVDPVSPRWDVVGPIPLKIQRDGRCKGC